MKTNTQGPPQDFHGFSARDRYFIEMFAEKTVVIKPIASRMDHGMGSTA
jgi:ribosomal protein L16/L10AE